MKKRMFQWMCAAILICGAMVFTACSVKDSPVDGETGASGIAMIVKNGQIDYFRQIETAFRDICQEKDLEAYYYATSSESAYEEQLAAVEDLRKLDGKALKGIIFTPSYGLNGESAEAEVAALAQERGIPVIILDSPVSAGSPLASCPYFGTDNTAAGQAMAEKVTADKVAVFAMTNSPGIERAEAFKALKPNADIYQVGDKCNDEVQAVLDEYDTFVFFNGNDLVDAIPMLTAAKKQVYTFDIYGEFLHEMFSYNPVPKGIMAQNTFEMARKAVEAVIANAKQGEMVPTFYLTRSTMRDPVAQPFLKFYYQESFEFCDGLYYLLDYSDNTAAVFEPVNNDRYTGDIVVPDTVEMDGIKFAVTTIDDGAFSRARLTSLKLPKTLKKIGDWAFQQTSGLKTFNIPETVTSIGESAFRELPDLTRIHIPASVEVMEDHAIGGCPLLESITIDEGNTHYGIYDGVLMDKAQTRLIVYPAKMAGTTYTVPSTVTTIDKYAFNDLEYLTSISIPASVPVLMHTSFYMAYSLAEINIDPANTAYRSEDGVVYTANMDSLCIYPPGKPDKTYTLNSAVKIIGKEAFSDAYQLETVTIPEGVTTILDAAFYSCTSLKEVSLPESLTKLGNYVFAFCEKLESVVLPPHINEIPMAMFYKCESLHSVTIPADVTSIVMTAFMGCTKLEEVTCLATTPPTADPAAFLMLLTNQISLYVPDESVDLYKAAPVWKDFNVKGISEK